MSIFSDCDTVSVFTGPSNKVNIYEKLNEDEANNITENVKMNEFDTRDIHINFETSTVYRKSKGRSSDEVLIKANDEWFKLSGWDNTLYSHNGNDYEKFYYYCGDMSGMVFPCWLPLTVWFLLTILPPISIFLIANVSVLKYLPGYFGLIVFVVCTNFQYKIKIISTKAGDKRYLFKEH